MNTSVYKVFCYFLLAFSLLISSRSFGLSGSSSDSVDLEKSYLSLDQLDENEVIVLDEDHQLAKNLLETFDLQPDQKVMVVVLDQNQQPINLEEDGSELLSMINSELEVKQSLDKVSYKTFDLDDVDQMALDQINDYNSDEDGFYQHISEYDLDHKQLDFSSHDGEVDYGRLGKYGFLSVPLSMSGFALVVSGAKLTSGLHSKSIFYPKVIGGIVCFALALYLFFAKGYYGATLVDTPNLKF